VAIESFAAESEFTQPHVVPMPMTAISDVAKQLKIDRVYYVV
jgi:hypothetical protein